MASFEVRGNTVRAVVRLAGGKKCTATFDTRSEATAWAAQMEHKKTIGRAGPDNNRTVGDLFEAYLPIAQNTDSKKWNTLRIMKWLNDPISSKRLQDTVTHDIDEWIARRSQDINPKTGEPLKGSTVNRELNLMSGAFTYAVEVRNWLLVNPCHKAQRPAKGRARNRPLLSPEEIKAICVATGYDTDPGLATLTARVGATFLLALETGMRSGEILRLRTNDYRPDQRIVHVSAAERGGRKSSKSGRASTDPSRNVPLTVRAMELLNQLKASMPKGQEPQPGLAKPPYIVGLNDSQRDALWRKARDKSGVTNLKYHDTKHEAATRLAKFLDVLALSHAIGTKDLRLLRDTYYNNDAQSAAALLPAQLTPEDPKTA